MRYYALFINKRVTFRQAYKTVKKKIIANNNMIRDLNVLMKAILNHYASYKWVDNADLYVSNYLKCTV